LKALSAFLPYVLPHAAGCTDPMAYQALREAANEFCTRSNIVQQTFTVGSVAGIGDYDFDVPTDMRLVRLLKVAWGVDRWLKVNDRADVDNVLALRGSVNGDDPVQGDPTAAWAQPDTSTFFVYPLPDRSVDGMFTVTASFAPTDRATQLDDVLFDRWRTGVVAGALAYLQMMPGQPFTAPTFARHRDRFETEIGRAIAEARKGAAMTSTRVKARAFA
jgi:hypothetical protein